MKGVSIRRIVSRTAFVAAGAALLAGVLAPQVQAQTAGTRPKVFGTTSDAVGVDYIPDQQGGLTPIQDTFHMQIASGTSSIVHFSS